MARAIEIQSDDGKSNLSAETWAAYASGGVLEVESAAGGNGGGDGDVGLLIADDGRGSRPTRPRRPRVLPPARESLTGDHVEKMLADTEAWTLVVYAGDDPEVLEKAALAEASDDGLEKIRLRKPSADEKAMLSEQAATGPLARLADAKALAPGVFAVLAAIGGLITFLADAKTPDLATAGFVLAVVAVLISGVVTLGLKATRVWRSRLDRVQARHEQRVARDLLRVKIPGYLVLGAIACFAAAFIFGDDPAPSASLKQTTTATTGAGRTAAFEVSWSDLGDQVVEVQTTASGGTQPASTTTKKASDGTAKQELEVAMSGPGRVELVTRAVNASGDPVGKGFVQTFTVK